MTEVVHAFIDHPSYTSSSSSRLVVQALWHLFGSLFMIVCVNEFLVNGDADC